MAKEYKRKTLEEKKLEVENLINAAEKRIEKIFDTPDSIKEYFSFMKNFYKYSFNNTILIQEQFRGATAVGSYAFWKEKGFQVNKGEKGIKILAPIKGADRFQDEDGEWISIKKASKEQLQKIKNKMLEIRAGGTYFSQGHVFDISQTNAKASDLPKIFPNKWLEGQVNDYSIMYKGMEHIANKIGVTIIKPKYELGVVKGVSYPLTKEVTLNPRNSQLQNVKTLLHELTHAKLHTIDKKEEYSAEAKEFQAEMTAYAVCSYFGIDTSEYSLNYIRSWTKNVTFENKKELLKEVQETAKEYIDILEDTLIKDREINHEKDTREKVDEIEREEMLKNKPIILQTAEMEEDQHSSIENFKEGIYIYKKYDINDKTQINSLIELKEFMVNNSGSNDLVRDFNRSRFKAWGIDEVTKWCDENDFVLEEKSNLLDKGEAILNKILKKSSDKSIETIYYGR